MEIRRVELKDAKSLIEHSDQVAKETNFLGREVGELNVTVEEESRIISRWNSSKLTNFLVGVDGDKIIASCIISGREGRQRISHVVTLGISVNKEYWGKGIATTMIEKQIQYSRDNGIKKINLEVMTNNVKAIKLYKKLGFKIEGTNTLAICVNGQYIDNYYMGLIL